MSEQPAHSEPFSTLVVTGAVARTVELPLNDVTMEDLLTTAGADLSAPSVIVVWAGGSRRSAVPMDVAARGRIAAGRLHLPGEDAPLAGIVAIHVT